MAGNRDENMKKLGKSRELRKKVQDSKDRISELQKSVDELKVLLPQL